MEIENELYTGADALTDALVNYGVSYAFINTGTDYPPIIESWAKYDNRGRLKPAVVICQHEMVALSAAQGYAQVTGQPQAVFVHVDVGTQNLGGSVHNACRCRVPAFILAGLSPFTMEGELKGTRNMYIQFVQNVFDQAGIVREYAKFCYEIRSAKNIQQVVYRALQLAKSEPGGPVYLMAAREVLEEESHDLRADKRMWAPAVTGGLSEESLDLLLEALTSAEKPLIITSYLGRNPESVSQLIRLCERLAVGVLEVNRACLNFPADHPMHLDYDSDKYVEDADMILVIDSDMPWVPALCRPRKDCRVFYLDMDPLKEAIPLWYIPAERFLKADSYTALKQLNMKLAEWQTDERLISDRRAKVAKLHGELRRKWQSAEGLADEMTPEYVTACLREVLDEDTVILNETITHHGIVNRLLPRNKPGTLFTSGGSALGWHGGAAIGVKLAVPDKQVVALTGDGTYIFSCPTAVYWTARRYKTPFMTVIYNNQGWGAPKMATTNQHPHGEAVKNDKFWVSFSPASRLDEVAAAAGGALARTVSDPGCLKAALLEGLEAVANGSAAVINVLLPAVSKQAGDRDCHQLPAGKKQAW